MLSGSNTAMPSFIAPVISSQIVLGFMLTVTDSTGVSDSDRIRITVGHDAPPTADAGYNINAFVNSYVILSGSGSDPESRALSYAWWTQTGISSAISSDSSNNGDTFTHTYRAPVVESGTAVLTFKFIAADSNWLADKIVTVTVYAP